MRSSISKAAMSILAATLTACAPKSPVAPTGGNTGTNGSTTLTGVALSPSNATILTGQTLQLIVLGGYGKQFSVIAAQNFTWSVAGTGCAGASCGTIDAAGKYTAPAIVPDPPSVTVMAHSLVDPANVLQVTVTISPPESFSVSRATIAFGNQLVDTVSAPAVVTVTNTGSTPQPVGGRINGSPGQWQHFSYTSDCPSLLAVHASCTFSLTFTPTAIGSFGAYFLIDGIFDEEGVVDLSGTATK